MKTRYYPPKAAWTIRHPAAEHIAARLLEHRDVLALRTRTLVRDIKTTHGVAQRTAMHAISLARAAA